VNLGRRSWRSYLHDHDRKWRTFKQNIESDTIIVNIIINLFLILLLIWTRINYKYTFGLKEKSTSVTQKWMPSPREQYGNTVHLFIGTGRSPCKITIMLFTFINNSMIILRGLIWFFIFKSVSLSVVTPKLFYIQLRLYANLRVLCASSYCGSDPSPKIPVNVLYSRNIVKLCFLRTFGSRRPPTTLIYVVPDMF
jgi:hypothetical protein